VKGDKIAVLIGDVSGHGVEAARIATFVTDVVDAFAHKISRPAAILSNTKDLLREASVRICDRLFGHPRSGDRHSEHTSAGHPPGLLRRTSGEVEILGAGSAPMGVFPGRLWKEAEVQLAKDDLVLLYTDGASEARRDGEFLGENGLMDALRRWQASSPERLPQALLDEVLSFSGGKLADDVAMLALSLAEDGRGEEGKKDVR
jgi:phosphoserine phosphatase RsbU/P